MSKWPHTIPHDLDQALDELERRPHHINNSDLWAIVFEWLHKHDVPAPENLPRRPELKSQHP